MKSGRLLAFCLLAAALCVSAVADENPASVLFLSFATQADMPQDDGYGNGTLITNGQVPRSGVYSVGVQLRGTHASHNHERWTVRWINPAGQVWTNDPLEYGGVNGDLGSGNYCWQYVCGLGTTYKTWRTFTSFFQTDCSWSVQTGWKWQLIWQYSDEIGPVTAWSAEVVAKEQAFSIVPGKGALTMTSDATIVHPASESSTGGSVHTTFDGGVAHLTMHARDCGNPPPHPVTVTLTANVVANSAGHNHAAPPRDRVATFDSMTCTTNSSGDCTITMTGEAASSFLKLKGHIDDWDPTDSVTTPLDTDEFNMAVAIPGLQEMAFDTSFVFPSGFTGIHPQNHFAQPEMISFINLFAQWYQLSHGGDRVRIDDMSLPLGGVFDLDANYSSGHHAFHRFGVDVDVSAHIIDATGQQVDDGLDVDDLTKHIKLILKGSRYPEGPIHYRFPANGIDEIIATRIQ